MFAEGYLNTRRDHFSDFDFVSGFIGRHSAEEIAAYCMVQSVFREQQESSQLYEFKDLDKARQFACQSYIGVFKTMFEGGATLWDWIGELKDHMDQYVSVYEMLSDGLSKKVFSDVVQYRLLLDFELLKQDSIKGQYYRRELLPGREDAVFVDCGAYRGETVEDFIDTYGDYRRIYALEPAPENFAEMERRLEKFENVVCLNKGISGEKGEMSFSSHLVDAANRILPGGDRLVEIVTLDEEIQEPLSFIKMDIEGAELGALRGSKNHIVKDSPQLAICVYHLLSDLREIPLYIHSLNPNQSFYLRFHGVTNAEEIVFYANPLTASGANGMPDQVYQKLLRMEGLMNTMQEAVSCTQAKMESGDFNSSLQMIDVLRDALLSCLEQADHLKAHLERTE